MQYKNNDTVTVKKINQTRPNAKYFIGNCLPTCIAMILGFDNPEDIIQIQEYYGPSDDKAGGELYDPQKSWATILDEWLENIGYETWLTTAQPNDEYYIANGITTRGTLHSVVMYNGEFYHDPFEEGNGLTEILTYRIIKPLQQHLIHS